MPAATAAASSLSEPPPPPFYFQSDYGGEEPTVEGNDVYVQGLATETYLFKAKGLLIK